MMNVSKRTGLFLTGVLLCACAGNLLAQQALSLDGVITQAARAIIATRLSAGAKLAVLNFTSTAEAFSDYVVEELTGALVMNRTVTVIERKSLDLIRKEMNLQLSGDVSDDSAQAIGKQLGAQAIVTGSLTNLGDAYRFRVKVINVETARIEAQFSYNLGNTPQVAFLLSGSQNAPSISSVSPGSSGAGAAAQTNNVYKAGDNAPAPVSAVAPARQTYTVGQNGPAGGFMFYDNEPKEVLASAPVNSSVTYRVGDKGPAGGVIFYVNPSATDGWRYLEAAPASTEFYAAWSSAESDVKGTNVGLGTGKPNTQAIVNHALNTGENCRAAMVCDNLKSGGYDDWFLPSKAELHLMFAYLKEAGIGGFKEDWYWSSSANTTSGAWTQQFSDGSQNGDGSYHGYSGYKLKEHLVRAIRQF